MGRLKDDYVITYEPDNCEEHDESTDFEDQYIPIIVAKGKKHHNTVRKINEPTNNVKKTDSYDYYPIKSRKEINLENLYDQRPRKILCKVDHPDITKSALSMLKHKVLPCVSSFIKRNVKRSISTLKEIKKPSSHENLDCSCQHCNCGAEKRVKKLYRKANNNYVVRSVYAMEDFNKADYTFINQKSERKRKRKLTPRVQYSTYNISSSNESVPLDKNRKYYRRRTLKPKKKREPNPPQDQGLNKTFQYPGNRTQSQYRVCTSTCKRSDEPLSPDQVYNDKLTSASSFWDYLFERFNKKYQTHRLEVSDTNLKECSCESVATPPELCCQPDTCEHYVRQESSSESFRYGTQSPKMQGIKVSTQTKNKGKNKANKSSSTKSKPQKVECQCQPDKIKCDNSCQDSPRQSCTNVSSPCQKDHDEIAEALTKKYNNEILCIHNPPCILINGCLNLPPVKEPPQQTSAWHVSEIRKQTRRRMKNYVGKDEGCQHNHQFGDVRTVSTGLKDEKTIQSICAHNPPCELVRRCYRPPFDINLQLPCLHVPMCGNVPECQMGKEGTQRLCKHKPKCPQVPLCIRHCPATVARESAGTQASIKERIEHRHESPYKPRHYIEEVHSPYERSRPDCKHQPPCELVPACWTRSPKQMVSVSSQYPNSCRIA